MALDERFIITSDLESLFRDKDTGLPLANGIVTFYSDIDRVTKKAVYQLTGSPPNYTYTALPNPCILSGVGTFQDAGGNNIVPYYFPYEGTPDDSDGTILLYYITVESEDLVEQFTREAWPNFTAEDVTTTDNVENFIPNGQFLSHTDITSSTNPPVITRDGVDIQFIAQGGWSFNRTNGGASVFNNSFSEITSAISGLNDFPRYAFNFVCSSFNASDQVRDLVISWPDINKFSAGNPEGSQDYTLFFACQSQDASTYTFDLRLLRYYGTGGSPSSSTDTSLGTIVIGPGYTYKTFHITGFPVASGTLGSNGDDSIALAIRGPSSSWNIQTTDFVLAKGNIALSSFPIQTNADMLTRSVAGWMPTPNPDGSDLYLPLRLTTKGMIWDSAEVGQIVALSSPGSFTNSISTETNELLADGTAYSTAGYSPLGIPYSRLQAKYWSSVTNLPRYGTGIDFVTSYIPSATTNILRISTNDSGSQTATADGASATGFTFSTLYTGNSVINFRTYVTTPGDAVLFINKVIGFATSPTAGTSGFTVQQVLDDANTQERFYVTVGALPAAGTYFTFSSFGVGNYYMWFTIDGAGADPAPGGTGIRVPLLSTYTTSEAAQLIREAGAGYQGSQITMAGAGTLTGGDFFTFHANGSQYAVWYKVAGVGSAPLASGTTIQVTLTGSETSAQVATKTMQAVNGHQFAVPNLKAITLRGWDDGVDNITGDLGEDYRFSLLDLFPSDHLGTYQTDDIVSHVHVYEESLPDTNSGGPALTPTPGPFGYFPTQADASRNLPQVETAPANSVEYGGPEVRVQNMSVKYAVKY
jgi:hypothetical protein